MKWIKALGLFVVVLTMSVIISSKAEATSVLTLMDGTDTWTLTVETSCTTCAIELKVVYGSPSPNVGKYLDSVQWDLTDPNVNPTTIGFTAATGFTASTPTTTGSWAFSFNGLNANQCSAGDPNAVCGAFSGGTNSGTNVQATAGGFGAIANGSTLTWTFSSTFASALPASLTSGNIRAAYNDATGQSNGIFSPGGGDFGGATPSGTPSVPEPSSLILLGVGLLASRLIFKRVNSRKA
jgi:PEP-CTERM motif